jgi:beta-galactosidase
VRSAEFTSADGGGLAIRALGKPLEIAAYPFAMEDLEGPAHPCDIPARDFATIHIDHAQMGVGGINSWGAVPLPQHMLPPTREYSYRFALHRAH